MKLSLAMIVKNEEKKLARCLESAKPFVDEIVIADTGSTDKTVEIARSYGANVHSFQWCQDFSKARNFSIEQTSGDYVLILDADSVIMDFPKEQVLKLMQGNKKAVGLAKIMNRYTEKNGEEATSYSYFSTVIPREARYVGAIHEQIESSYPRILLPVTVFHDGYDKRDPAKFTRNIEILERELAKNNDPYLKYKLAQEYEGLGNHKKAGVAFESAYARANRESAFFPNLVTEYLTYLTNTKKFKTALAVIEDQKERLDDFPEFHFTCGVFYTDLVMSNPSQYISYFGKIPESYIKAVEIGENPKYPGVVGMGSFMSLHNLGAFYEVTGDVQNALNCYKSAMEMGYKPSEKRFLELSESTKK